MPPASVVPIGRLTTTSWPRACSAPRACASASRRPAPSGPSKLIRNPGYGRSSAIHHLPAPSAFTPVVFALAEHPEMPFEDRTGKRLDLLTLGIDLAVGVDDRHFVFVDHLVVLVHDAALEQPITFLRIVAEPKV